MWDRCLDIPGKCVRQSFPHVLAWPSIVETVHYDTSSFMQAEGLAAFLEYSSAQHEVGPQHEVNLVHTTWAFGSI